MNGEETIAFFILESYDTFRTTFIIYIELKDRYQ